MVEKPALEMAKARAKLLAWLVGRTALAELAALEFKVNISKTIPEDKMPLPSGSRHYWAEETISLYGRYLSERCQNPRATRQSVAPPTFREFYDFACAYVDGEVVSTTHASIQVCETERDPGCNPPPSCSSCSMAYNQVLISPLRRTWTWPVIHTRPDNPFGRAPPDGWPKPGVWRGRCPTAQCPTYSARTFSCA